MSKKNTYQPLQFFEYERVSYIGKWNDERFLKNHFQAFEQYYNENPNTPFFELIPNGVRFKQYVGVIQIGKTTIEVLPKSGKENNKNIWQGVLLDMLKTCNLLTAKNTGTAQLRLKSNSLLHLYFELFLNEVEILIQRGLIKKYRRESGQAKALKGPIQFAKHISKNTIHKERFYINKSLYDNNHLIHQILNETIKVVSHFTSESIVLDKLNRIKTLFPITDNLRVKSNHFKKIPISRKHIPYEKALLISELIIMNYRPDIKSGNKNLIALMFDMNKLWEEYILQSIKKEGSKEFIIRGQKQKVFWNKKVIKPDIVLESRSGDKTFIIDTKWKVVNDGKPGDDDLKQMYAYNYRWNCNHSMLLYPSTTNQNTIKGDYFIAEDDKAHSCELAFAEVLKDGKLNRDIAKEILESFEANVN
ncbi:5-methylcytosine-specific restriction enzyme subunit McrC [Winogradskyella pacifica]|uniref:5-methylcytosine-specific restriction enzyme subunit McrC n=1 Tax=Winogradskyella pacifica TaxID=664642 RepID=A0A3D9N2T6_9FLAO|nr:restriction endonuclease [Winogradskyella pacifica]REE27251.1 5-methylcytosine-specific restriction enzyme subunit McrC [Winogradskyella pacifica]